LMVRSSAPSQDRPRAGRSERQTAGLGAALEAVNGAS
jgi:hypothetical protein